MILFLIVAGLAKAKNFDRWVLAALVCATIVLPIILTMLTVSTQGLIWQGRYELPWSVGILLVVGLHLDRSQFLTRERGRPALIAGTLVAMSQAWSVWGVAHGEVTREDSVHDGSWITLPPLVLGTAAFLVWFLWITWTVRNSLLHAVATPKARPDRSFGGGPVESQSPRDATQTK